MEPPYRIAPPPRALGPFAARRRNLAITIVLSLVTFGIYELVWYWQRRRFFDALAVRSHVTLAALGGSTVLYAGSILLVITRGSAVVVDICAIADLVLRFVIAFQARATINEWAVRERMPGAPSGLWTFFFRYVYLQRRINRIAERDEKLARLRPRG